MNRYKYAQVKEPDDYPRFCIKCERQTDPVNKSGLCLRHILESRIEQGKIEREKLKESERVKFSLLKWIGMHE